MVDLTTITNSAFTPSVFASPGAQPIRHTAPYDAIDVNLGPFVTWDQLLELAAGGAETNLDLNNWPRNFDYVVVLNLDRRELRPPGFLSVFHAGSFFTIFKIDRSAVGRSDEPAFIGPVAALGGSPETWTFPGGRVAPSRRNDSARIDPSRFGSLN